jgi:hypothetical protein
MDYALSDSDIKNILGNNVKIINYCDIYNYNSVDDLLDPYDFVIILYEMKPNFGHWCLFFKRDNKTCEFFDSYGVKVDDELDFVDKEYKNQLCENYKFLSYLIYKSKYQLQYNPFLFQKYHKNISTCGRWCIFRYLFKSLTINKFNKMINGLTKSFKMSNDELVTYFIDI